jgi:hypothetical protein
MKIGDLVRHRAYDTLNVIMQRRPGGIVKVYCIDEDSHYVTVESVFEVIKTDN